MKQSKIKTIFFGTHDFAVVILQGLIDNPLFDIEMVITQPDRPVGRKKELTPPPVKILAEKNNINVDQPKSLKSYILNSTFFDLAIVAQYGLLIPENIINTPTYGTINVHTSILPKYRGASPIQSALIAGEEKTGVTIMKMDVGMDTGDIILQKEVDILPDETYLELDTRLAYVGVEGLNESIPKYISGELKIIKQDNAQATICKKLSRDDGKINWNNTTQKIYNQYRGLTPWPGIWTTWKNSSNTLGQAKRLKLLKIQPAHKKLEAGKIIIEKEHIYIGTHDSSIQISELQLEGKPVMDTKTFINGYNQINNQILI